MRRVTLAGEALHTLDPTPYADRYVKIVVAPAPVPEVDGTPAGRPTVRAYTVRAVRPGEWDVDVLLHGDVGLGGPWAARVCPGDEVAFLGPGGGYTPDPSAPWHLLAGDESALPAIASAVEAMPPGADVRVFVEVGSDDDRQSLTGPGRMRVTWVERGAGTLEDAVRGAHAAGELPDGAPHAFLHGEADAVRVLRRFARAQLGVPPELLSASGYWRRGADDAAWRAQKARWRADVERDDAELQGTR
jgi:NADPH-dependent ferric siderophore reductase